MLSSFMDALRKEAAKDPKFQESMKEVSQKVSELRETEAAKATGKVLEKAKETAKTGKDAIGGSAQVVRESLSAYYTKMGGGRRRKRKLRISELKPSSGADKGVMTNVSEKLEGLQGTIVDEATASQYGGIRSKAHRERLKQAKMLEHERLKETQPTVEVDPEAGSGVELHKDSKWKVKWNNFKDNNKVFQSVFEMKKAYDQSNNIFVHFAREVTASITDRLKSVFEENEAAKTIKKISERDPNFTQENFLKEAREFIIPEVLEAYLSRDVNTLQTWCSEGLFNFLKEKFKHDEGKDIIEAKLLDLRHVELMSAKLLDDNPVMVITFNAQHLIVSKVEPDEADLLKEKDSKVADEVYCEDKIENLYHVWALVKDMENDHHPVTGGWKVMEMATRNIF